MKGNLYKYFETESDSGFCDDISVILIAKTKGSNPI